MKMKKITNKLLLTGILFLLSTIYVHAGFGVSPTDLDHKYLKPGLSFEKTFTLSRSDSLEEMDIYIEPDFDSISSWFTYQPSKTFKFKRGQTTATFTIITNVPENAPYQEYEGVFRVKAVPSSQNIRGISIIQGVRLDAGLVVTEVDVKSLRITAIDALDSEVGKSIQIQITGTNDGNVDASPTLKVPIMDLNMNVLEEHEIENFGTIGPNETATLIAELETNLPTGEYFLGVKVYLDDTLLREDRVVFNINNIPEEKTPDEEVEKTPFINSIMGDIGSNLQHILISIFILIIVYILLDLIWKKKDLKEETQKWWAVLLGSKTLTRALLSFFIALQIMLILILYPLVGMDRKNIPNTPEVEETESGETQGVKDVKYKPLDVLPSIEVDGYNIYEKADTNSKVIYIARENETFDVVEERDGWYKVLILDDDYEILYGWLPQSIVKSVEIEEE